MDEKKIRRLIERARRPYRIFVCSLAAVILTASTAVRALGLFEAEGIERAALCSVLSSKKSDGEKRSLPLISGTEKASLGLYEEEFTYLDAKPDQPQDDPPPDDDSYPITALDLSGSPEPGELLLRNNETDYSPDLYALRDAAFPVNSGGVPTVLIVHTHGSEAYSDGSGRYDDSTSFRSDDPEKSVVAVGGEIARVLESRGIVCYHCEIMHDLGDFNHAYDREKETILEYLEAHPEIDYVLDVHRDAIVRGDNEMIAPTVQTPYGSSAQIMLVVGSNAFGADHPTWEKNLNLACKLQTRLNAQFNLARPVNVRGASFNEQFRSGSLLVEVGSSGNTLEEAKLAGRLFAQSFADLILENAD